MAVYLIEVRPVLEKHRLKQFLRKFRFRLSNTHRVPHVTLIYSFVPRPPVTIDKIAQTMAEVAMRYDDLRFLYDGVAVRRGHRGLVLAFNVTPSLGLMEFQRELYQRLRPLIKLQRDKEKFTEDLWFHAAISFGATERQLREVEASGDFERLRNFLYPGFALRISLLRKGRIVYEYDTVTKTLLRREEALSRHYLSKTYEAFRERFLKVNVENKMRENIWFIADTHFGHENIIKYCSRPFVGVDEMDEFIIRRWNEVVSPNDVVYVLGDFTRDHKRLKELAMSLKGKKVFIQGNHDVPGIGPESVELTLGRYKFLLTHKPTPQGDAWNVHGHVHNNRLREFPFVNARSKTVNVGVDVTRFYPVNLSWVLEHVERNETVLWLS